MGETLSAMSVAAARQLLRNTSNQPSERVDEAQRAVGAFYDAKPRHQCPACSCRVWSEHETAAGQASWACAGCHRSSTLTAEEWSAQRQAAEAVRKVTAAREAAAAPKPRTALSEALALCAELRTSLQKIEAALPAARSTLVAATLKHERAAAEAAEIEERAAAHLADSIQGKRPAGPAPSVAAARAALVAAADGLAAARGARGLLDAELTAARAAVAHANDRARRAATRVIAAERLEGLLTAATEGRANYLESVGALGWLLREHAIPLNDRRAHQILGEANTPPSAWPEAKEAGTAQMEAMRAALMADPEAII